jgi:hypothetical protein
MRTVVVRVGDADFSNQMAEMRQWLDRHRYEPVKFVYNQTDGGLVISVGFAQAGEAEAFATHFDGREPAEITLPSEEIRPADLSRLGSA